MKYNSYIYIRIYVYYTYHIFIYYLHIIYLYIIYTYIYINIDDYIYKLKGLNIGTLDDFEFAARSKFF